MADEFSQSLESLARARAAFDRIAAPRSVSAGSLQLQVSVDPTDVAAVRDFLSNTETILRAAIPPAPVVAPAAADAAPV